MIRGFAVVALLPACDVVFGIHSVPDARPDVPIDAPPQPPPCSQITMLGTDFETNDAKALWPLQQNSTIAGGVAILDVSGGTFAALDAGRYYGIRELAFSAKLTAQGAFEMNDAIQLELIAARPNYAVTITRTNGKLMLGRLENGMTFSMGDIDYTGQDYWRIARHGGDTDFDFSTDGVTWTTATTYPGLDYLDLVRPYLSTTRLSLTGFVVHIDDVEGGTASGSACKIATLTDDFSGSMLGLQWQSRTAAQQYGTLTQQGGVLDFEFIPSPQGTDVHLIPISSYDIVDGAVTIEVPQMIDTAAGSGQTFSFAILPIAGKNALFSLANGSNLTASYFDGAANNTIGASPYSASSHRWLRMRTAGTTMFWETSADGRAWNLMGSALGFGDASAVDIVIQISGVATVDGHLVIDNFDLPPQ